MKRPAHAGYGFSRLSCSPRRRWRRIAAGAAVAIVLLALAGCEEQLPPPPDPSAPAPGASASRQPPDWYLSKTDRFQRLAVVAGTVTVSPGGGSWLQQEPQPDGTLILRGVDAASGTERWQATAAALRAADGAAADAALIARITDAGWLLYRTAPAGAQPTAGDDFPPGSGAGEWKRFFPNTGRGKPLLDGFQVVRLSRNLRFGVGRPVQSDPALAALPAQVRLAFSFVEQSGVLQWSPLPAELTAADTLGAAVAVVGDTGALQTADGRLFDAAGQPLAARPGQAPWNGAGLRRLTDADGEWAAALSAAEELLPLPQTTRQCWFGASRIVVQTEGGWQAIDPQFPDGFRELPLPTAAPMDDPAAIALRWEAWAVVSEDLVVIAGAHADGTVRSSVFRWELLR